MSKSKWLFFGTILSLAIVTFGCGGGSGGSSGGGSGTLSLSMTDAAADFEAVFITIDEVQIHLGGNDANPGTWKTLTMQRHPITVNLMDLTNGVREQLGLVDLPAGDYTQMRMIIGETPENTTYPHANYVVDKNVPPNIYDLKVPSGTNTGFKIVENFTIADQQTLELVLDFDASKSVIEAGSSGQWLLKPTVKIQHLEDASIVKGQITKSGNIQVAGAMVSAQQYDPNKTEPDKVIVATSTFTDSQGKYSMFLSAGTYNIVVTAENLEFNSLNKTLDAGITYEGVDFLLDPPAVEGDVEGTVSILDGGVENYATLSFRRPADPNQIVEIKSVNVLNGHEYKVTMQEGTYSLIASSIGYDADTISPVTVSNTTPSPPVNIAF
jgi:hypothetical protein